MYLAVIVAVVVVLSFFSKPRDKQSYRMALMAIFGIAYFCLWRFIGFYMDISEADASSKKHTFLLLMLSAAVTGFLPWVRDIQNKIAISLVVLFVICVVPTFLFEINIKDSIAVWGGYFDDPVVEFDQREQRVGLHEFHYSDGGLVLQFPPGWQQKMHGSGMSYFARMDAGNTLAEVRPRCFHNTVRSIPEIINNIFEWDNSSALLDEKKCFIDNDAKFNCFILSRGSDTNRVKGRWRWLIMDKYQRQNTEIDVVFYSALPQVNEEAQAIIRSIKWVPLKAPLPTCVSPVDWF